ncbi:MAG: FtsQ-type POTRA domain-containing protein [Propionibacteriaceae bacterium]|nr:FtsQ-type POTRA domain-containing protein [Propionibacteriaceae bacterium]
MPTRTTRPRVSDATTVIRARHRARSRRRAIRVTVIVAAVVLVLGGMWAVWLSNWFVARSVDVTGTSQISAEQIVATAQVPLGTPLARVDLEAIRERVIQEPVVADAKVSRELSGVIRIDVTERAPAYAIVTGSQVMLVDATGKGYLLLDSLPEPLPIVTIANPGTDASQRLMADAAVIITALPDSVRSQMLSMGAQTPDTFTINLTSGAQILWGSCDDSALKAQVIDGLIHVPASYYDVSAPTHPATR